MFIREQYVGDQDCLDTDFWVAAWYFAAAHEKCDGEIYLTFTRGA